jgi:hypothetical protein
MKNNKKGLSTIVATLLIILLTLVAVGIIWVVVKNVVTGGSDQVTLDSKCLSANVVATKVTNVTNVYSVTLSRQGGTDELGGVKLVFTNEDGTTSSVVDVPGTTYPLAALSTITVPATVNTTIVPNPSRVNVFVYFLDSSGNPQLCKTATQLTF